KRQRGYYAMPLLFGDAVIGWVNIANSSRGLEVDVGFVGPAPRDKDFRPAFDAEVARFEHFMASRK
ncbi:MAG: hypothetical protein JO137_03830, partial [Hyphomicrobiales bacterium]|nr:hypothetical protein [Hyphomicrobiales bacterium]